MDSGRAEVEKEDQMRCYWTSPGEWTVALTTEVACEMVKSSLMQDIS